MVTLQLSGDADLLAKIEAIEKSSHVLAKSALYAGLGTLASAAKNASPGSIKQETGFRVYKTADPPKGYAGLIRFPRRGDGQNGPHGVYLELGTKFITARRFIATALRGAIPRALEAMRQAAERRVQRIIAEGK